MKKEKLQNGLNALIAYYFINTGFTFLDEFDLAILTNLASKCGIDLTCESPLDALVEFHAFLLREIMSPRSYYIDAYRMDEKSIVMNGEEKSVFRFEIDKKYISHFSTIYHCHIFQDKVENDLVKLMGQDKDRLENHMPNSETLRKYITLKKLVMLSSIDMSNDRYKDFIASSDFYGAFNQTREISSDVYAFIDEFEKSLENDSMLLKRVQGVHFDT